MSDDSPNPYSDEVTGLPPLNEPVQENTILGVQWAVGHEAVLNMGETTAPVRYLSVRGLVETPEGPQWQQIHVAFPSEVVPMLLGMWVESIDEDERAGEEPLDA